MLNLTTARAALTAGLLALSACATVGDAATVDAELRAREDIRELIHAYGRTLDARDFDAFAALWTDDAEYVGGPGGEAMVGGPAIAAFLEEIFADNPSGLSGPTAHLFANEHIEVEGDAATGASLGAFLAPAEGGGFAIVILATYEDAYVREDGRWRFARRVVRGLSPAQP